ncbi:MAG: GNAT family N-acetyltransferase [Pirellulales bacterium]
MTNELKLLPAPVVRLRHVVQSDLEYFFEHQCDLVANQLAGMKPQDEDAFNARWEKILNATDLTVRTILAKDMVVGSISTFPVELQVCMGYWIDAKSWGQGIATEAVRQLLPLVSYRPLFAYVAEHNIGSSRVLQKNGFVEIGRRHSGETDRYCECTEIIYRLA